jgi:hypothetical protein
MEEELKRRFKGFARQQELERLERMADPRLEKLRNDPELQKSLQSWREAEAKYLQEANFLDGEDLINGPTVYPPDPDNPYWGIPDDFLPSGLKHFLKALGRYLRVELRAAYARTRFRLGLSQDVPLTIRYHPSEPRRFLMAWIRAYRFSRFSGS